MAHAQQLCRRHGGVVLALAIGDKGSYFYASFGAAQANEEDARRSFGAIGDEVDFAAAHYAVEAGPPVQLKGKPEPLPVFALLGEGHKRALRLQEPAFALPMVGRDAEMAVLADKAGGRKGGPGVGFLIQGSRTKQRSQRGRINSYQPRDDPTLTQGGARFASVV